MIFKGGSLKLIDTLSGSFFSGDNRLCCYAVFFCIIIETGRINLIICDQAAELSRRRHFS
jgi:hypothetical protein